MSNRHSKGGYARAAAMTPEARRVVAQKAAAARWGGAAKTKPKPEPKSRIKVMSELSSDTASRVQKYAHALCDVRTLMHFVDSLYADAGRDAPEALPYFDAVKRVMEIDTEVTDPTVILLRLSVGALA